MFQGDGVLENASLLRLDENGQLDGCSFPLAGLGNVSIGSDPACRIFIPDPSVLAIHARLWIERGEAVIAATIPNAVSVDGEPVDGERPLRNGDRVALRAPGRERSVQFVFCLPPRALLAGLPAAEALPDAVGSEVPRAAVPAARFILVATALAVLATFVWLWHALF